MQDDELQLRLLGQHGRVDARALHRALGGVLDLLAASARGSRTRWAITGLREGSAEVAMRPRGVIEVEALEGLANFTAGVERLEAEAGVPPHWDVAMVETLISVASVVTLEGVEGAELSWGRHPPVRLDHDVLTHAQDSLSERHVSLGSVRGRLDRYLHRASRREVGLIDDVTGDAVRVTFPERLQGRVIAAMERDVLAWGELRRNDRGQKVRLKMEDFEVLEAPTAPRPSADEMIGALGEDWTHGLSSVDWVRAQRRSE